MIPELGQYRGEVLTAYGASILLILAIVILTVRDSSRTAKRLRHLEEAERDEG